MKTPREILLDKHRDAVPALNALREKALDEAFKTETALVEAAGKTETVTRLVAKLWQELVFPYRRIWSGLALAWMLILGLFMGSLGDGAADFHASNQPIPKTTLIALRHQRLEIAKLIQDTATDPAEPPQHLQPRTFLQVGTMVG